MATKLSIKKRKLRRDKARTYQAGEAPAKHKVAVERSKKALKKKAYPMT